MTKDTKGPHPSDPMCDFCGGFYKNHQLTPVRLTLPARDNQIVYRDMCVDCVTADL